MGSGAKVEIREFRDATLYSGPPELLPDVVHVWRRSLSLQPQAAVEACYELLSPEERERANRYRVEKPRTDFILTRGDAAFSAGGLPRKDAAGHLVPVFGVREAQPQRAARLGFQRVAHRRSGAAGVRKETRSWRRRGENPSPVRRKETRGAFLFRPRTSVSRESVRGRTLHRFLSLLDSQGGVRKGQRRRAVVAGRSI